MAVKGSQRLPVGVLMEHQTVTGNRWISERWVAAAVVAGEAVSKPAEPSVLSAGGVERRLYPGFALVLYVDDAPNYYGNLMAASPRVFVVCAEDEDGGPIRPVRVTVSYGEASAYMETDEPVFSVPMPPEVHTWVERFVVEHYVPEEPKKRKRKDWKAGERGDGN